MIGDAAKPCEWGGSDCQGMLPANTRRTIRFCGNCAREAHNAWHAHRRRGKPWSPPRLNVAGSKGTGLPSPVPSPAARRPPAPPPEPDPPDPLPVNDPTLRHKMCLEAEALFGLPHVVSVVLHRDGDVTIIRVGDHDVDPKQTKPIIGGGTEGEPSYPQTHARGYHKDQGPDLDFGGVS